jgi:hypothetical protein
MAFHNEFTLERKEGSTVVTGTSLASIGRVPAELPLTAMIIIRLRIPLIQPGGTLDVPRDDWAALHRFAETRFGGNVAVNATLEERFYVVGEKHGLPCYECVVELPDDVNLGEATKAIDEKLTQTLTANLRASRKSQAA